MRNDVYKNGAMYYGASLPYGADYHRDDAPAQVTNGGMTCWWQDPDSEATPGRDGGAAILLPRDDGRNS